MTGVQTCALPIFYERNIETLRELGHEGWKKLGL